MIRAVLPNLARCAPRSSRFSLRPIISTISSHDHFSLSHPGPDVSGRRYESTNQSSITPLSPHPPPPSSIQFSPAALAATIGACPGCGALAQTVEPNEAGHYSIKRKAVQSSITRDPSSDEHTPTPLCDRCHDLLHHHAGVSIAHPSLESIQDTIAESPYKHNHIYHVIDAADFPMSLIPNIHKELEASLQRSQNRRAKHAGYRYGKKTEMSFIITRSDLLAPKKDQVDRLMNYLISVLRRALGPYAEHVRLGNVRCVSAKRGWWTKEIKQNIWDRGGAGWMVGKVNVGKSNLYEVVFPKGRAEEVNIQAVRNRARALQSQPADLNEEPLIDPNANDATNVLLPPARAEAPFPVMPTISSLPGTTASPIRIPFGNGKGELIDLPGLDRNSIEGYVLPEHRESLVMKSRVTPEQYSIKEGKSLVLADLIRITPVDPHVIILAYPFVPLAPHLTSTVKAIDLQAGTRPENTGLSTILTPQGRESIKSAGRFQLRYDVTKQRAGPLTTRSGVGLRAGVLPFIVLSADILIEGIGWVELVAQVRRQNGSYSEPAFYPEVDIFSPNGKHIAAREPMGAWLLGSTATKPGQKEKTGRPRRSMATAKRARTAS